MIPRESESCEKNSCEERRLMGIALGDLQKLRVTIEDRLAQNIDDDAIYLLTDPGMKRIAGNLASWPPMVTDTGPWYELPVMRAGMIAAMLLVALPRASGNWYAEMVRSSEIGPLC